MQPCDSLIGPVRDELNHILTEPPFRARTGMDMGWFCREHALLTAMFLSSMGYPPQLCRGDIVVKIQAGGGYSTFGTDADHAWCVIDDVQPIDLSMTLRYSGFNCDDVQVVCGGADTLSGFELQYFDNIGKAGFQQAVDAGNHAIMYNEKTRLAANIKDVANDPYSFLHRPAPPLPAFTDLFGKNVFYAITAHLLKLISGEAKPLHPHRTPEHATQTMLRWNPGAKDQIEALL